MAKKMAITFLAVASLFLLLRSVGFVMNRVVPFEKRRAGGAASR